MTHTKKNLLVFIVAVLFFPVVVLAEILPYSQDFDGGGASAWIASNHYVDNGASASLSEGGGWGGSDALLLLGPTVCTGGNGQDANITVGFSSTGYIHFRYLIKLGTSYWANSTSSGCAGFDLKHIEATGTATRFISSVKTGDGEYGLSVCNNSTCKYENGEGSDPDDGNWWPEGTQTFNWGDYVGEWVCLEYIIDSASTGLSSVYVWTRDGAVSGLLKQYYIDIGGGYTSIELGNYYNHRLSSQTNAEMWVDNLIITTSATLIGPPTGFVTGEDTTDPTATITTPTSSATYDNGYDSTITLGGTSSDNVSVSSVTWACPKCEPTSGSASGTTTWTINDIGLSDGENVITVTATDPSSNTGTDQITVSYTEDLDPPVISSPLPSGSQACDEDPDPNTLQVTTDEAATCRYSTSDVDYSSMGSTFSTTGGTSHSQSVSNACGDSYTYYVRCIDGAVNSNSFSTEIGYSVAASATPRQQRGTVRIFGTALIR
jgi:hypothetical protein